MRKSKVFIILSITIIVISSSGCSFFLPDDGDNKVLLLPEVISPRTSYTYQQVILGSVVKTKNITMRNFNNHNIFNAQVLENDTDMFYIGEEGIFTVFVTNEESENFRDYLSFPARIVRVPEPSDLLFAISIHDEYIGDYFFTGNPLGNFSVVIEKREDVLIVPKSALRQYYGQWVIGVLKDGTREDRVVEIGIIGDDNRVEITSGLTKDEYIVFK